LNAQALHLRHLIFSFQGVTTLKCCFIFTQLISMMKFLLPFAIFFPVLISAQNAWHDVAESSIPTGGERRIVPQTYRTVTFDLNALQALLAAAPLRFSPEATGNTLAIELPTPDGRSSRFLLTESPTMMPALQAQHPDIRCYTGTGIDDPTAVLKCDLTPHGFHAQVLRSKKGDWFIDPYSFGNRDFYTVYFKKDYALPANKTWDCQVKDDSQAPEGNEPVPDFQGDCKLRQYALAMACTGEYAGFHGGTTALAAAAINTSVNRVNGVYEIDFAITMILVSNNNNIIYLDGATDPYTNNNGGAMLGQNQTTCDNVIGNANYDIGHVFSTGGGGVATLACVCVNTTKARGVTGGSSPIGDPFDIDYVAHEIGHQFNGSHTFNGTAGSCSGNGSSSSAYEPGSGSTIMAYAGICGSQNVQNNSDAYFHARSLQQTGTFVTGSGHTCDTEIVTGNSKPVANAGADYAIPKSTPFVLTGTGTDPNGDALTYCWEQYDNQSSTQPPVSTSTVGPNFRSFIPTTDPARYFPSLPDVINNNNPTWEVLSSVARTMNFRLSVRDNYAGAGCTHEDNMVLTVASSGPFQVTAPNTAVSWAGNSTQTVTWNVNGTTGAPVSCNNVEISLSTDGGNTYSTVILASTPNDGTQSITVPNIPSTTCRIKITGVGNVFYDISNVNFTITLALPVELLGFDAGLKDKTTAVLTWATASEKDNKGFEIQQAHKNSAGHFEYSPIGFLDGQGNSYQRHDYSFEVPNLAPGTHYFRLRQLDFGGEETFSPVRSLEVRPVFLANTRPNPFQQELEVQIFQEKAAMLEITLVNQWGQKTTLRSLQEVDSGETLWRFNLDQLPDGVYYLLVDGTGQGVSERVLVLKKS
jgi:Metallo-peptidase family M12B Reprolysin-like